MAKKMTKAQMEAFKKKNFDKTKKVSKDQLDKLRKEGTPEKAIAKYKNDPAMREALNRFYGKDRVSKAAGSASTSGAVRGGPGAKIPKRPAGGPGAKMTARDGRGGAKSSTAKPASNKSKMASTAIPGRNLSKMTPEQRKRNDQLAKFGKDVLLPAATLAVPGGGLVKAGMVAKGAKAAAMANAKKQAASNIAKRSTMKASDAMAKQKAATAAKNAIKTGRGSGAGSAAKAKAAAAKADAAKAAAAKAAEQARNANARARSLGTPVAKKTGPKSKSAAPKAATSGTAKQADDMLMNMKNLAKKKSVRRTGYAAGTAAYLARPNKKDEK
jgi:hypothetical protein